MINTSEKILYCDSCNNTKELPICCTITMEIDNKTFFCEICGKEEKFPKCCEKYMTLKKKEQK